MAKTVTVSHYPPKVGILQTLLIKIDLHPLLCHYTLHCSPPSWTRLHCTTTHCTALNPSPTSSPLVTESYTQGNEYMASASRPVAGSFAASSVLLACSLLLVGLGCYIIHATLKQRRYVCVYDSCGTVI